MRMWQLSAETTSNLLVLTIACVITFARFPCRVCTSPLPVHVRLYVWAPIVASTYTIIQTLPPVTTTHGLSC